MHMENTSIIKQAKSDIFKELHPIIKFYINKGASPHSLKKYYKNTKRFEDLLEDIKNKASNLIKDEIEYKKIVKEILNDILDDFIAKEKDEEYKKKSQKMKHIKEFNSYQINEEFSWILSLAGAYFFYRFIKGVIKNYKDKKYIKKYLEMTPQERSDYDKNLKKRIEDSEYKILLTYVNDFFKTGNKIKFSENYLYYIFDLDNLTVKIDKFNKTIIWNELKLNKSNWLFVVKDKEKFTEPIPISEEDINGLVDAIKEEENENEK
jgi:hypothetical protein